MGEDESLGKKVDKLAKSTEGKKRFKFFSRKKKEEKEVKKEEKPKRPVRKYTNFSSLKNYNVLQPAPRLNFIAKLFYVIAKNFKLLVRSRTSALIFFFGPLFIMFVVSMGFNTSTLQGINVATYSEAYSGLAESLMSNLTNDMNIEKLDSEETCINAIKFASHHICVIFPPNMAMDNSANNVIQIYVDDSRINLANAVIDRLSSKVAIQSRDISSGLVGQLLGAMDEINKEAEIGKQSITVVSSSNSQSLTKVQTLLGKVDEFDFGYTALDTVSIDSEINDIKETLNTSSSIFSDLEDLVDAIAADYNVITGKLNSAKSKVGDVQEQGQNVKTLLQATPGKIDAIDNSFDQIKEQIGTVKITNVANIVAPLKTTVKPLTTNRSYLAYILPPLLVLLVMFVALLMSSTGIVREKKSSAHFRNFITPTNDLLFIVGQFITDILILAVQIVIMLGVAAIFIQGIPWHIYFIAGGILLVLAVLFIFAGIVLGNIFNTGESVAIAALSVGIISLLFSNTVLPLEAVGGFLRSVVYYNPFVISEAILRQLLVFESFAFNKIMYAIPAFIGGLFVFILVATKLRERVFNNG